jgi:hypothetical protein
MRVDNYGISSLGFPHYLAVYRHAVRQHHPSLVVVCVFLVNDLGDSTSEGQRIAYLRPHFGRDAQGRIVELLPFDIPRASEPARGVRALLRDHWATGRILRSLASGEVIPPAPAGGIRLPPHVLDPWPAETEEAWQVAEWSLRNLLHESRGDGARVLLVSIPGEDTGSDAAWSLLVAAGADQRLDRDRLASRLAQLCESEAVPFRDLSPEFRMGYAAGRRLHFPADGHLTAEGHTLVAKVLAPLVEETLAISR